MRIKQFDSCTCACISQCLYRTVQCACVCAWVASALVKTRHAQLDETEYHVSKLAELHVFSEIIALEMNRQHCTTKLSGQLGGYIEVGVTQLVRIRT